MLGQNEKNFIILTILRYSMGFHFLEMSNSSKTVPVSILKVPKILGKSRYLGFLRFWVYYCLKELRYQDHFWTEFSRLDRVCIKACLLAYITRKISHRYDFVSNANYSFSEVGKNKNRIVFPLSCLDAPTTHNYIIHTTLNVNCS